MPSLHHLKDMVKLNVSNSPAEAVEAVELKVHMDCPGCERTVRKSLSHLKGIHSVDIDREQQKVTVTGSVDKKKVLNRVRRKGKVAEEWPPLEPTPEEKAEEEAKKAEEEEEGDLVIPNTTYVYGYDPTLPAHVIPVQYVTVPHQPQYVYDSPYRYNTTRVHGPVSDAFSEDNANNCAIM